MGVSLVHIGLPKTGTTTLQNAWRRHPGVCLGYHGVLPLVEAARALGRGESPGGKIECTADQPLEPGQQVVFSHEALSLAYLGESRTRSAQRRFQEAAAALMARAAPGARVLLVTRDPERWLRSLYNQTIKQGGLDTMEQFLEGQRETLLQAADIAGLRASWQRHFGAEAVLTLPMELLLEDPTRFYATIEDFAGVPPPPDDGESEPSNRSLDQTGLRVMRGFNVWLELLLRDGAYRDEIPPEILRAIATVRTALRYNLEHLPPGCSRLEEAAAALPDPGARQSLDGHPLLAEVTRRLAGSLDDTPYAEFGERYRGTRVAAA